MLERQKPLSDTVVKTSVTNMSSYPLLLLLFIHQTLLLDCKQTLSLEDAKLKTNF